MPRQCKACEADITDRLPQAFLCIACALARQDDPAKAAAHKAVATARRAGLLVSPRSLPCADCGAPARHYDHREYAKPLQVEAVCHRCNLLRGPAIDSLARNTSRIRPRRIEA